MVIKLLAILVLGLGAVFSFGAYQTILAGTQIKTLAIGLIPSAHLLSGFGLLRLKSWARYWTFSLAFFYLCLGILDWQNVLSAIDFIPVVPLIAYLPNELLRWGPSAILTVSLFVLPLLVMLFLSLKHVAIKFESWLDGQFAWSTPFAVVLACAFIFSYSFLANSELAFFIGREQRTVFGFSLPLLYGRVLRYFEFSFPLILALGLISGGRTVWFLTLALAFYYWSPVFLTGSSSRYLNHFDFMFFGIGWIFVVLILLFHWRFFFQGADWVDRRTAPKPMTSGPIEVVPVEPPKRFQNSYALPKKGLYLVLLLVAGALLAITFYYWDHGKSKPIQSVPVKSVLSRPTFKLEGFSVDRRGSYAIINGNVVQVGTVIEGYRVEVIEPHRVLFSKDGVRYWLDDQGRFASLPA